MATEAEVLQVTGHPLGAVSSFGTKQPIRILVDRGIFQEKEISVGSGVRYTTVIMQRDDFLRALGKANVGDFASQDEKTD